jgi:CRISPR-associated endonuclease Csn1
MTQDPLTLVGGCAEWNEYSDEDQNLILEDLLTINKKSVLKNRFINHWRFDPKIAVSLTLLEFEPGHY